MKNEINWVEKYRPTKIKNIVQQDEIKQLLNNTFINKTFVHMLFYGPPGTGKTTTALTISKKMFKMDDLKQDYKASIMNEKIYRERILELNASDERGIKVVRDKIKNFATSSINSYNNIPNYKIIILDEADAMTSDSQFALRRIIEKYTETTRFILICNYVTKIIPPLTSRCMKLRFQSISHKAITQIIIKISNKEKIKINNLFIDNLCNISKGDLRKTINLFERTYFLDKTLNVKTLNDIAGLIEQEFLNEIFATLQDKNKHITDIIKLVNKFQNEGYSSLILLDNLFEFIINSLIDEKKKTILLYELSKIDYFLNNNSLERIQLYKIFSQIKTQFL
jgi:replication factor C subunit 2/4